MGLSRLFVAILVLVAIVVLPLHIALAQQVNPARALADTVKGGCSFNVTPKRALPDTVEQGQTFNVTVNFTSPADMFNCIALSDNVPYGGWIVTGNKALCTPNPNYYEIQGNVVGIQWTPYFDINKSFIGQYRVKVPCNATVNESYSFGVSPARDSYLVYYVEPCIGQFEESISGNDTVTVKAPAIRNTTDGDFYAAQGQNPQNRTLELWSSTTCWLNWSLDDDADWLSENITSGSCNYTEHSFVALSANTSKNMSFGNYTANITINANTTETGDPANNSPQNVTVGLYIRETGTLEGHVTFPMARVGGLVEPFEVKLFHPNTTNVIWADDATTNSTGVFTIPDVVVATYDVGIKNATCLSELEANITVTGDNTTVVNFTIREGDIDDSDYIDMGDYSIFSAAFHTKPGDYWWDAGADLDRNNWIDMGDYSMFSVYFNKKGDAYGQF